MRISFTKEGLSRFLGHRDLMCLWQRALRRAGLPLAFSEGYNPRPQISFPVALALGFESLAEIFEVELVRWIAPRRAAQELEKELPEGIGITNVESVRHSEKAEVTGTCYTVRLDPPPGDLEVRLASLLAGSEAFVTRRRKSKTARIDARQYISDLRLRDGLVVMDLSITGSGTARPEEVLQAALECPPEELPRLHVRRTRLDLAPPHS